MPRRNFNKNFDRGLIKLLDKIPGGDIGKVIVGMNAFVYGLYLIWPAHNTYGFMNNFTFSTYGLSRGYFWNMLTAHFTHMSFFSCLIDSGIIYLLCQNLNFTMGNLYVAKTVLLSILLGTSFTFLY